MEDIKRNWKPIAVAFLIAFIVIYPPVSASILTDIKYQYDPTKLGNYEVSVVMELQYFSADEPTWIDVPNNASRNIDEPTKMFYGQRYLFLMDDLDINASWSYLVIHYFVEVLAYENFYEIECKWRVEGVQKKLSKHSQDFIFNGVGYEAVDPRIENEMFKDNVPNRVEAEINLYSR